MLPGRFTCVDTGLGPFKCVFAYESLEGKEKRERTKGIETSEKLIKINTNSSQKNHNLYILFQNLLFLWGRKFKNRM